MTTFTGASTGFGLGAGTAATPGFSFATTKPVGTATAIGTVAPIGNIYNFISSVDWRVTLYRYSIHTQVEK